MQTVLSPAVSKVQADLSAGPAYLQEGVHLLLDPVHEPPLDD